jgi:hypothetical protein
LDNRLLRSEVSPIYSAKNPRNTCTGILNINGSIKHLVSNYLFFFFFSRLYNPSGFRPAQLSLSILSRKVLQSAVASGTSNPQLGGEPGILERSNFRHKRTPASEATLANPAAEGGIMGEKWQRNFAESGDFHVTFRFFYMP